MRFRYLNLLLILIILSSSCGNRSSAGEQDRLSMITFADQKRVDVNINGKLFTSFCWPDSVYKPILYPVITASGIEITRGFPLKPREGEQIDHLHQVGIWLNYGKVNGYDFWGNGYRGIKEPNGGVVKHTGLERLSSKNGTGLLVSLDEWIDPSGNKLLDERTEYNFISRGDVRIIDRITTLKAGDSLVKFDDTKEGMFAMRVARQLELPSKQGVFLTDTNGKPSLTKDTLNAGVTGNYRSSENITGEAVWGKRAKWMELSGIIGTERVAIIICDHPKNPGYPTYWHARGYGLFSANPFGWKDFTNGKESFNFSIPAGKSVKLRYRVIINSGTPLTDAQIAALSEEFGKKYKRKK
jgi:hypothetical protein